MHANPTWYEVWPGYWYKIPAVRIFGVPPSTGVHYRC
jgi:hypothetical protein